MSEPSPGVGEIGRLGIQFTQLAAALAGEPGTAVDPDRVVQFADRAVPNAQLCGLTLIRPGHQPQTVAHTDPEAAAVDALQHALGEGPCLDAARGTAVILSDDLAVDGRWTSFGPRCAAELSVRSVLSIRLALGGTDGAALNLYSHERAAFGADDVAVGSLFAPFAGLAVQSALHEQDVSNLQTALTSSRQIGTAIGIIMAREQVGSEDAFAMLRRASQDFNLKLRDVAAEVAATGTVPRVLEPDPEG